MGSPCAMRLVGRSQAALQAAAMIAIDEVRRIEQRYSRYREDSLVSRINAAAGTGRAIEVDAETAALFDFAAQLNSESAGRFDITSGVLRRAWDWGTARVPGAAEIEALRPLIGWPQVHWDGRCIALPKVGMQIDLGGIGKEYAADRATALLVSHGVAGGFVDLGGDIVVIGPRADAGPWSVGLQHPREAGALLGRVELARGALATSGDYARFVEFDGRRYSHLLDATTGWPAGHWQSVSVLAPNCTAAGAVATLAMLQDESAIGFLRAQGLPFLAVRHDGTRMSGGGFGAPVHPRPAG
ncbi:MAG: FAD:protein FMN transferase [Betaproteobacteria bacterium]|nr:FAD:protein FMN transferase [Betaproteobacteria bacterium]